MMQSLFGTTEVRSSPAAANNIGPIVAAPDKTAVRVLVNNIGPVDVLIGLTTTAVAGTATGSQGNFRLQAGRDFVFVLAPRQTLYAVGIGNGGRLSYAVSEALPIAAWGG
jgi:hypothetical protein